MVDKIQSDLKNAQLSRDEIKVSTLRLLLSEIKNAEISKGGELVESDIISIAQKEVKKRKEAAIGFRLGQREQQALKEESEMKILEGYLPVQLSTEELTKLVEAAITEVGATSIVDIGKVIGVVMGRVQGQADGGSVSSIVKMKLT